MDQMRQFLERVLPWGDADVWHNLHYFYYPQPGQRVFTGTAFKTIDEFCRGAAGFLNNPRNSDLYFCTSTQRLAEPKTNKRGGAFNRAIRNQDNAVQFKSFFVDVDVGKPGSYQTRDEALLGLKKFYKDIALPPPNIIVNSGSGGFHVYWALEEPILRDEWQPYASALAMVASKLGFRIDAACTFDAARVLRLPGTFNHKHDPKRPVTLALVNGADVPFLKFKEALEPYVGEVRHRPSSAPYADDLAAGIHGNTPPVNLDSVLPHCPFLNDAVTSAGKSHEEPLWHMAVMVSTFTEGGAADAHRMSSGHPDYTPEETDKRYERVLSDREAKGLGWPQCETIMLRGCKLCQSCPHLQERKSPLNLGKFQFNGTAYTAPASTMPRGYRLGDDGLTYLIIPAKNIDEGDSLELVCNYPLLRAWIQTDPWVLHFFTRLSVKHHQQLIHIPIEAISNRNQLVSTLGAQGIALTSRHVKLLGDFFVNWIQKLREIKASVVTSTPFGWHIEGGNTTGFAYGGLVYSADGSVASSMPDFEIASRYTPKGDIAPWRVAAKLMTDQHQPWINAILASSFAAPLAKITGYYGFMMSCYSAESGIGKSTATEVAQMVWGSAKAVAQLSDTHHQVSKRMGILKALPIYWDEIKTSKDVEQFIATVFQITSGREKGRLKSDTSFQVVGDWETIVSVASNESMIDHIMRRTSTTSAGIMRIFEFKAHKSKTFTMDAGKAIRIVAAARENYGRAGEIYAKWLGGNIPRITREVAALDEALRAKYKATEAERLWFGLLACLLLGLKYAIELKLLECTPEDIRQLKVFLFETALPDMRRQTIGQNVDLNEEVNVAEILSQFLRNMKARHTITTDEVQMASGRPPLSGFRVLSDVSKLDELKVHFGLTQNIVRFSVSAFNGWLIDRKYPVKVVTDAMISTYGMRKSLGKLGAGTQVAWDVKANFYEIQNATLLSPKEVDDAEQDQPTMAP